MAHTPYYGTHLLSQRTHTSLIGHTHHPNTAGEPRRVRRRQGDLRRHHRAAHRHAAGARPHVTPHVASL
eukprot:6943427-Prymnesium_polylepis.1